MNRIYYLLIFSLLNVNIYSQDHVAELSHYILPEFTQGVILMKNGTKHEASLNYNSLTEEMVFEENGKKLAIGQPALVDTIYIKESKFCMLNNKFVELLYHSTCDLYVEHRCWIIPPGNAAGYGGISQTSSVTSNSSYISSGRPYELELPDDYEAKPYIIYWLKKDMALNNFMNIRQLKKLYDGKKDLFKAYVKEHDVKYDNQESIVQLIEYLETN